jgi:predicted DsbA family dithiol-disulfide isomerase
MSAKLRIDIFSDTVCPWCFLGKRRFEAALARRPHAEPRVVYRPFELNPDLPQEGVDRAAFLAARINDQERFAESQRALVGLGAAVGITFRFDRIERVPNTRRSHLLIALAARRALQSAVKERVMRAYFEEGADIGDVEELVRLGVEAGLPEHETRRNLVLGAGTDAVVAAERHAVGLGLSGVPTFIFDGQYTLSGAQEPDMLLRVFDQVADLGAQREAQA